MPSHAGTSIYIYIIPLQKVDPLRCLALRTRIGRFKSSFVPWELSLPTYLVCICMKPDEGPFLLGLKIVYPGAVFTLALHVNNIFCGHII